MLQALAELTVTSVEADDRVRIEPVSSWSVLHITSGTNAGVLKWLPQPASGDKRRIDLADGATLRTFLSEADQVRVLAPHAQPHVRSRVRCSQ